jgi:putative spermidine/putrescine transport system permease protein
VLGVALYLVFANLHFVATFHGLVIAHVAMALPYVVVNILAALQLVDRDLERAARSLGANPLRAFVRTTLPLTAPGILAAAIFAFVISWDEVVVAIFLSGPTTQTLPIVMWSQMRTAMDPTIAAVATILMFTTLVALAAGSVALRAARRRATVR